MRRKQSDTKTENIVDFKKLISRKKRKGIYDLDYDEFKYAVTQILVSMAEAMGENNKKIDKSFARLIGHLESVSKELRFIKQVLYMERILNGEHRDGPMNIAKKASLAKEFGIDFNKFVKQVKHTGKSKKSKNSK